jgi:hypothetical protein
MSFAQDEDVVQTLPADRADEPLGEGILPRAVRGGEELIDPHALNTLPKRRPVDAVAIAEEIGRCAVIGESVHDLLGGPVGGRVLGHVEVDDASAMVNQHDENEEDAQARSGDREEIEGDQIPDMVDEECPPGLRRPRTPLRHEPRDGALGHVDAELQEFAMDSWGAPQGVRGGHTEDQHLDLSLNLRATSVRAAGELGPILAEATPLPMQNGGGGHDHEGLPPPGPDIGQPNPEEAISWA